MSWQVRHGDCLELMRAMPDNSVDAVVTDPPYGLSFMGKKWDYDVPSVEIWAECLRVLKPGGHLLAFAGTRTQHRMAVRIEDAGFEIRDMIAWVYGSGFPKSLDVSKAIDKAAGAEREVVGKRNRILNRTPSEAWVKSNEPSIIRQGDSGLSAGSGVWSDITAPATPEAERWQGWGTSLKPALEPITVARKPLVGTVAENVLEHGTGALNIDGCRVGDTVETWPASRSYAPGQIQPGGKGETQATGAAPAGRWPANLIHDGSDEVLAGFPDVKGVVGARREGGDKSIFSGGGHAQAEKQRIVGGTKDTGSAARFFYCAKASKADRDEGCDGLPLGDAPGSKRSNPAEGRSTALGAPRANHHPTVKPTALMRYLCRLVTPPGGTVLDPFTGSGSTGKAAKLEGFNFIGMEREAEYVEIARARIAVPVADDNQLELFPS